MCEESTWNQRLEAVVAPNVGTSKKLALFSSSQRPKFDHAVGPVRGKAKWPLGDDKHDVTSA